MHRASVPEPFAAGTACWTDGGRWSDGCDLAFILAWASDRVAISSSSAVGEVVVTGLIPLEFRPVLNSALRGPSIPKSKDAS